MKTIRLGSEETQVKVLQHLLKKLNYSIVCDGVFGAITKQTVKAFQQEQDLVSDGIVGKNTWKKLLGLGYKFSLGAANYKLKNNEFFSEVILKKTIYLHHTAGKFRPTSTIKWWEIDKTTSGGVRRVATAFVIGRKSPSGKTDYDGQIYRAFDETKWAHHLGIRRSVNTRLNKESIGIEICALGPLKQNSSGQFYREKEPSYIIPAEEVCELDQPWRGHTYFHKYTPAQIAACKELILNLAYIFDIDIPNSTYDRDWFTLNEEAFAGKSGVWTHANVRTDKTDCFPQPAFIEMLNSLYGDFQNFEPANAIWYNMFNIQAEKNIYDAVLEDYSRDLNDVEEEEVPSYQKVKGFYSIINPKLDQYRINLKLQSEKNVAIDTNDLVSLGELIDVLDEGKCFVDEGGTIIKESKLTIKSLKALV